MYTAAKSEVKSLNVTNDAAERNVKLNTDFLCCARSKAGYQNALQVVQNRNGLPNLKKSSGSTE